MGLPVGTFIVAGKKEIRINIYFVFDIFVYLAPGGNIPCYATVVIIIINNLFICKKNFNSINDDIITDKMYLLHRLYFD